MLLSLPLALGAYVKSVALLMGVLFFAMFVAGGFVIISVAYATSAYSSDHAGFLAGLGAGSWSALVALAMPWFGRLFDMHAYPAAFATAAAFPVLGWALWRVLARGPAAILVK